jgi:hypothetical protein
MIAYALTGLGRTLLAQSDPDGAVDLLERALSIRDAEDEDKLNIAETNLVLAQALWRSARDTDRAMDLVLRARDATGAYEPRESAGLRKVLEGEEVPRFTDQLVPAGLGVRNLRLR